MLQRIEPYGWDSLDRTYFVLDDNRVYRMTEPPPPPPKTKKRKSYSSSRRSSKRRRTTQPTSDHEDEGDDEATEPVDLTEGLGGAVWECVAISLDEVRQLVDSFRKSRDDNEKVLRRQLDAHLIPILEKQEESRKRKELQRERELLNLAKMANAKRSSRIANKAEQKEEEERMREEERKLEKEETARRKEEEQRRKLEKERDSRLLSREKRLKEREVRRRIHEEELAQLSEDSKSGPDGSHRISERRLHAEIERNKQALQELAEEDEDWVFDCVCGLYGQIDDGTHSVACERCNIWQHSKCIGVSEREAEKSDFHFICRSCRKRMEEASTPRKTIKIKIKTPSHAELSNRTSENDVTPQQLKELRDPPPAPVATPGETNSADAGMRMVNPTHGQLDYAQQGQLMTTQNGNGLRAPGASVYKIQQQGGSEVAQKPNSYGMAHPIRQDTSRVAVVASPHTVKPSPATGATLESNAPTVPKLPQVSKQDPPMQATQARSIYDAPKSPSLANNALPSPPSSSLPSINPQRVTNVINSPGVPLQRVLAGSLDASKLEPQSSMSTIPSLASSASQQPTPTTRETQQERPPHTLPPPISSLPLSSASQPPHRPQEQPMTSDGEHRAQ